MAQRGFLRMRRQARSSSLLSESDWGSWKDLAARSKMELSRKVLDSGAWVKSEAEVELSKDGRQCGSVGAGRRHQVTSSQLFFLWIFLQVRGVRSWRSGGSDFGQNCNIFREPGHQNRSCDLILCPIWLEDHFYGRRTENVHDAYATFALPPHHCTYHTGWILSFCLSLIFAFFLPRTRSLWAICWCTSARWRPLAARCEADVDFLFHPKFW